MRLTTCAVLCTLVAAGCSGSEPVPEDSGENGAAPAASVHDSSPDIDKLASPILMPPSPPAKEELGPDRAMAGRWFGKEIAGRPAALFGPPETEAQFTIRCAGEYLVLSRGIAMREGPVSMALMAGGKQRTVKAQAHEEPRPDIEGRLPADDEFSAILAETSNPVAVRIEDGPALRMPASDVMRDVVRQCRA